ncbi:MAG: SsrA-binding protein SmpB [Chloroflexota bacterium]
MPATATRPSHPQARKAEKKGEKPDRDRTFASNRRAYHDYHVLHSVEAGVVLTGTEIKSVREGRVNLRDGYARVQNGEVWLYNVHISTYDPGNRYNHEPMRPRKLLLHHGEIVRLQTESQQQGLTLVPLRMYQKKGFAKIEIAVVRGKKQYDKRESIADRDARRDVDRALREAERGR